MCFSAFPQHTYKSNKGLVLRQSSLQRGFYFIHKLVLFGSSPDKALLNLFAHRYAGRCEIRLASLQWITNPNPTSSKTQRYIPSRTLSSPSTLSESGSFMARLASVPNPNLNASPKIVVSSQRTSVTGFIGQSKRLWTLFIVHSRRKKLELSQIRSADYLPHNGFFKTLRETYRELRGLLRVWFSFWQFWSL